MSSSLGRAGRRDGDANWNQPGMKSFVSPRSFPSPEGSQGGKWSSQAAMSAKPQGSCSVVLKLHSLRGRHTTPRIAPHCRSHHNRPPTAAFLQNTVALLGKGWGKCQQHEAKHSPWEGCPVLPKESEKSQNPTVFEGSL